MTDSKILKNSARKPPAAGRGRPKGSRNKVSALLKDAIIQGAIAAGGGSLEAYLVVQAKKCPAAYLALLGKILPMQLTDEDNGPVRHIVERRIIDPVEIHIVRPDGSKQPFGQ